MDLVQLGLQHQELFARGRIPEMNPVFTGRFSCPRGQHLAIWRIGQSEDRIAVTKTHGADTRDRSRRQRVAETIRARRVFLLRRQTRSTIGPWRRTNAAKASSSRWLAKRSTNSRSDKLSARAADDRERRCFASRWATSFAMMGSPRRDVELLPFL